jgi:hypothetical protein
VSIGPTLPSLHCRVWLSLRLPSDSDAGNHGEYDHQWLLSLVSNKEVKRARMHEIIASIRKVPQTVVVCMPKANQLTHDSPSEERESNEPD